MTKKSTSTKVSLFVIFVLVSAIFSVNGNVYAQNVTSDEHIENATHASTVTRDSQTILLEGESLPEGSFIHLYDSTPYQINNGHVVQRFHVMRIIKLL